LNFTNEVRIWKKNEFNIPSTDDMQINDCDVNYSAG